WELRVGEVGGGQPSGMIVLEHCDNARPGAPFAAGVGIVTFGPPQARYGIEQIVFRSACPDAALLSILRRFVRGDLPTTVWCTDDLSLQPPLQPLLEVGRQLLYDSRRWRDGRRGLGAVAAIAARPRFDVADLNWRRLAPLRGALVDARGPLTSDGWRGVDVRMEHAPGGDAIAWLCAGWLRAERSSLAATIAPDVRSASLSGEQERLLTVSAGDITATLTTRTVEVAGTSAAPLTVGVRNETEAEA